MRYRILRTIGASVVLAGIAVAAISQVGSGQGTAAAEIAAPDTTTTVSEDVESTTTTTMADEPFSYRIGLLSGISTDNFWAFYGEEPSVWNSYVLGPTKPALYTTNSEIGAIEPELAVEEAEPVREDDTWKVDVELARDLDWSDGTPITAHDLVFTFETVRALELGGSWVEAFPAAVRSVEARGDHDVTITFTERPRLAVWPHGVGLAPIMARHVWEGKIEDSNAKSLYEMSGDGDVGGGPLVLASVSEDVIVSRQNDGYPLADVPDEVEYRVYENEPSAVAALADGAIDYILSPTGITDDHAEELAAETGVSLAESTGNAIRYVGFNLNRQPMSDQAFRSSLALLVDREGLSAATGAGPAAWALVPEANTTWYDPEAASEIAEVYRGSLADRLALALEMLEEAGYEWQRPPSIEGGELAAGDGLSIEGVAPQPLTILTPGDAYDPERPEYAAEVAAMLEVLGFDARPVETDFDTVVDLAFTPDENGDLAYDMYLLGWTLGNPGLPGFYGALFAEDGPINNTGYSSEPFEEALEAYEAALSTEEAMEKLWEMERTLAADLPYLLLYNNEITEAYRSDRIAFSSRENLGGIQARLGGIWDVRPAD